MGVQKRHKIWKWQYKHAIESEIVGSPDSCQFAYESSDCATLYMCHRFATTAQNRNMRKMDLKVFITCYVPKMIYTVTGV